ncbi:MAG TPA: hypothetical protein P5038_17945 [Candidatus Paceibacterota bacterium]|nr:hypothetical protein [Candidatus Paceibacterota bacterium]
MVAAFVWGVVLPSLALTAGVAMAGGPALRVVRTTQPGIPLLKNGGFEEQVQGQPLGWRPWQKGFDLGAGQGRAGSAAIICERDHSDGERGASQTLELNRTHVAPLVIRGWSKAQNVSGSADSGYSLYVDLIYADGSPLWGRTVNFRCGTHDWEQRQFVLLPEKPVQRLTLHCLFRGHTGKVWFDDVSLEEIGTPAGAVLLQGTPVEPVVASRSDPVAASQTFRTGDGLELGLRDGQVTSLRLDGLELAAPAPSGFLARDFGSNSDFYPFNHGVCEELGLRLEARFTAASNHLAVEGRLADNRGVDRAVTLLFALPVDATGWQWGDDVRRARRVEGRSEFAHTVTVRCGSAGRISRYPLGAVWTQGAGLGLGLDLEHPAQYSIVCHPGTRQFFIAFDFALVQDTARFPGAADFRFVIFRFEPKAGFRAALAGYYAIFPSHFARRVTREGLWMPFTDIARVPAFEDFGFAFQEGAPNVPFDDAHGIASFYYVEPMSYWLALPAAVPRTYESALDVLRQDLTGARGEEKKRMAAATLTSGIQTDDGRFALYLVKAPWCDGGVFTLNPDPGIATNASQPFTKASVMRDAIEAAFAKHRPPADAPRPGAGLDGLYYDSLEMSAGELNYRREHFKAADTPLVFDADGRPCQLMIFNTLEFVRETAGELHRRGHLTFANSVLWNYSFPAPFLDVLGTEVNWLRGGAYEPDPDTVMNFRRALCRQKPYCLLLNTDYQKFTPALVERYFQRCLFYGIWPGFFDQEAASKDPYWVSANKYYERDRPLFKKYIPLFQRLAQAGWEPVTLAASDNPNLWLERFGAPLPGRFHLTLFNPTSRPQEACISLDVEAARSLGSARPQELVSSLPIQPGARGLQISLGPEQAALLYWPALPPKGDGSPTDGRSGPPAQ